MNRLAVAILGTGISLAALFGAAPPAQADPGSTGATSVPSMSTTILGQAWSAPAFPVDCQEADRQISCTPTDASQVTAQRCFTNVLFHGERTMLCTTFEDHAAAIQNAGGKPLLVQYGCSIGDVVCLTFENAGKGMALSATATMYAVADNTRFDTSSVLWTAATDEWSFWQWAVLIVLFGAMVWAITAAVISQDRAELVGAIVRTFIAVPAVFLTLWLTGRLLNAIDEMTWYIVDRGGPGSLFATLQGVMWAGGQANYFFAFVIHTLLFIAMILLMVVFAFRNIVLAALIAVGPIAWMIFPIRSIGPQWVVRYASSVVVLLLTGPLTIGFVSLIIRGLASVKTIWNPQAWPLLFGLVLVAFAPFAVFGLFSFVGAVAADGIGSRVGSHAGRAGSSAARTAVRVPTRLGGSPAGISGGRSRGPATRIGTGSASTRPSGPGTPAGAGHSGASTTAPRPAASTTPTSTAPPPERSSS